MPDRIKKQVVEEFQKYLHGIMYDETEKMLDAYYALRSALDEVNEDVALASDDAEAERLNGLSRAIRNLSVIIGGVYRSPEAQRRHFWGSCQQYGLGIDPRSRIMLEDASPPASLLKLLVNNGAQTVAAECAYFIKNDGFLDFKVERVGEEEEIERICWEDLMSWRYRVVVPYRLVVGGVEIATWRNETVVARKPLGDPNNFITVHHGYNFGTDQVISMILEAFGIDQPYPDVDVSVVLAEREALESGDPHR